MAQSKITRLTHKPPAEIEREWDAIAFVREEQILQGKDISFSKVLLPAIVDLSTCSKFDRVIDVGCGLGFIMEALSSRSKYLLGVDLSGQSIRLAQRRFVHANHVHFYHGSVEDFSMRSALEKFSLAIANMTLMTSTDLDSVLHSVAKLLQVGAHLVFTITHPCYWARYWGYESEEWFRYDEEIFIEAPFKITGNVGDLVTTHVHRPLFQYINSLQKAGFCVEAVKEPFPPSDVDAEYLSTWQYPRFLAIRCVRT